MSQHLRSGSYRDSIKSPSCCQVQRRVHYCRLYYITLKAYNAVCIEQMFRIGLAELQEKFGIVEGERKAREEPSRS